MTDTRDDIRAAAEGIKRHDISWMASSGPPEMRSNPNGDWVLYGDIEAALRSRDKLAYARGLEDAAACCDAFDGPPSDSDFVMGQATAAQQIRARIRAKQKETEG